MNILYKGSEPPPRWSDLEPIELGVSEATLKAYYEAGVAENDNYSLIVQGLGYWYPPRVPVELVPSQTEGRDLTWDEFLDVGRAVDAAAIRAILKEMPDVVEYGRKYVSKPGIQFADASAPGNRLSDLVTAAINLNLFTEQKVGAVLAAWVVMYPKMVPAA